MYALLVALLLAGEAEFDECGYCWPGWTQAQAPMAGWQLSARKDPNRLLQTVHGISPRAHENQGHLVQDGTEGAQSVDAVFAFEGSQGKPTWSHLFSAPVQRLPLPETFGWGYCDAKRDGPSIVADAVLIWTLFDDGNRWVGISVGTPNALGLAGGQWPVVKPAQEFSHFALLERQGGKMHVLAQETMTPPIQMHERVRVQGQSDARAVTGTVFYQGGARMFTRSAALKFEKDPDGLRGVIQRLPPQTLCSMGGFLRDVAIYSVD